MPTSTWVTLTATGRECQCADNLDGRGEIARNNRMNAASAPQSPRHRRQAASHPGPGAPRVPRATRRARLPHHDLASYTTCSQLSAGSQRQTLMDGEVCDGRHMTSNLDEDDDAPRWSIVPARALPYPFNLSRCRFADRHATALEAVGSTPDECPTAAQCSSAFDAFIEELADLINACPFHQPDWRLAAERAIDATHKPDSGDLSQIAVDTSELDDKTSWAAWSFFSEPIWIDGDRIGNGQHRLCAMKCTDVSKLPIESPAPGGA